MQDLFESRVMSGMRPTGTLHLGHLFGTLAQWNNFSTSAQAFFEIADLHALTTRYADADHVRAMRNEMVIDWLAAGLNPEQATIFLQSGIPEISELQTLLGMIVPVAWLQRVPTYKDQITALGPEIATYGFLGYPLLQLCDIAIFRASRVPVGRDQLAHLEVGREVVRKFNALYGPVLVEPQAILTQVPEIPGIDGRKMSKSYNNGIALADDEATTVKRVRSMITDPQKVRRNDPGRPEICPVFTLHHLVNMPEVPIIEQDCRSGALGCVACKLNLAENLNAYLAPLRERRKTFAAEPQHIDQIIRNGTIKAREVAHETITDVKSAMNLT